MDGHNVVGVGELFVWLGLLTVNYIVIYLVVSNALKHSKMNLEINNLKNEVNNLRELLNQELTDKNSNKKD